MKKKPKLVSSKKADLVGLSRTIAIDAHSGQTDRAGVDYMSHVEAVVASVTTDIEKSVAYLHDVVEDTSVTFDAIYSYLVMHGVSRASANEVVAAVRAMTKIDGEEYESYLRRIKSNKYAVVVKLADLRHNMDLTRLPNVDDEDLERMEKYKKAIAFLTL